MSVVKSVSLSPEAARLVDERSKEGLNFSEFVNQQILLGLGDLQYLKIGEQEYLNKLASIRKQIAIAEKYQKQKVSQHKITEAEKQFFKDSKQILAKDPAFLAGRIDYYKNTIGKNITREELLRRIDKL